MLKYFKKKEFEKSKLVAQGISEYYCEKNGRNPFCKKDIVMARRDINHLGITDLKLKGNKLTVKLKSPGYLIGRKGENIDKLKKYLSVKLNKELKIFIIEDMLMGWLEPVYFDNDMI